nr:MAG TPA: hypothetical protein [Caudoviricetes sp.]
MLFSLYSSNNSIAIINVSNSIRVSFRLLRLFQIS